MSLFARFVALKKKVGGNREKREFEMTMGATPAERIRVTGPTRDFDS